MERFFRYVRLSKILTDEEQKHLRKVYDEMEELSYEDRISGTRLHFEMERTSSLIGGLFKSSFFGIVTSGLLHSGIENVNTYRWRGSVRNKVGGIVCYIGAYGMSRPLFSSIASSIDEFSQSTKYLNAIDIGELCSRTTK
jgi:hypothetical protein